MALLTRHLSLKNWKAPYARLLLPGAPSDDAPRNSSQAPGTVGARAQRAEDTHARVLPCQTPARCSGNVAETLRVYLTNLMRVGRREALLWGLARRPVHLLCVPLRVATLGSPATLRSRRSTCF